MKLALVALRVGLVASVAVIGLGLGVGLTHRGWFAWLVCALGIFAFLRVLSSINRLRREQHVEHVPPVYIAHA